MNNADPAVKWYNKITAFFCLLYIRFKLLEFGVCIPKVHFVTFHQVSSHHRHTLTLPYMAITKKLNYMSNACEATIMICIKRLQI